MNEKPHIHEVTVRDFGDFWSLGYGDQRDPIPNKPWRRPWDSDRAYEERLARSLKGHIRKMVRAHDQGSIMAGHGHTAKQLAIPQLDPDRWGSEQL